MIQPGFDTAIYACYPQVTTVTYDEVYIAYDAEGNVVEYDTAIVNSKLVELTSEYNIAECKQTASELLYKTDWTTIPDVADPQYSPYLMNQIEFKQYRAIVRDLAVNPVADPVWPTQPTEQWSS